jgi:hypothetical protein
MHFLGDGDLVRRDGEPLPADAYSKRKVWGLWNSLGDRMGNPQDAQLRPWFYTWSLLSRYFPAGCEIVSVDVSNSPWIAVAAAQVVQQGEVGISLAIVSRKSIPQVLTIRVPALETEVCLSRFDYFDLDADNRPDSWPTSVDENGSDVFPEPTSVWPQVDFQRGLTVELPGRGVAILTSLEFTEPRAA